MKALFSFLIMTLGLNTFAIDLSTEVDYLINNTKLPIDREIAMNMVKKKMTALNHFETGQSYYLWKKNILQGKCRYAQFEKKSFLKVFKKLKAAIVFTEDFFYPLDKKCQTKFPPTLGKTKTAELEFLPHGEMKEALVEIFPPKGKFSFYKINEHLLLRVSIPTRPSEAPVRILFDLKRPAPYLKRGWTCRENKKSGCYQLLSTVKNKALYLETYSEEKVAVDEISPMGLARRKILPHRFSVYGAAVENHKDPHYRLIRQMMTDRRVKENAYKSFKQSFFECSIYSPRTHNTLASECVGQFLDPSLSLNVPTKNKFAACQREAGDAFHTVKDYYFAADNHYCLLTWYSKGQRWLFKKLVKRNELPHFLKNYSRK